MENELDINKKSVWLSTFHKFKNEITDKITKLEDTTLTMLIWMSVIQGLVIISLILICMYK